MDKKSNILDWFFIIMILFTTGICVYIGHLILTNASIQQLWVDEDVTNVTDYSTTALLSFDNIMLFIVVGLSLFVLISAALIQEHPALFFVSIILLCIAVSFAAITANVFWDFSNTDTIATTAGAYPKITFLMNNLPLYIAFMGIAVVVVAYVSYTRT